jgi:hypothetical protein
MIEDDHASPVTISGLSGGHRYWVQIEAVMPSGAALKSWPVIVTARIPDDQSAWDRRLRLEKTRNWRLKSRPSHRQVAGFQQAATQQEYICCGSLYRRRSQRDVYQALFTNNPGAMPAFGALLDRARIRLSQPPGGPAADSGLRTAEYELEVDGFTFYVRWIKSDDTWMLMDFKRGGG